MVSNSEKKKILREYGEAYAMFSTEYTDKEIIEIAGKKDFEKMKKGYKVLVEEFEGKDEAKEYLRNIGFIGPIDVNKVSDEKLEEIKKHQLANFMRNRSDKGLENKRMRSYIKRDEDFILDLIRKRKTSIPDQLHHGDRRGKDIKLDVGSEINWLISKYTDKDVDILKYMKGKYFKIDKEVQSALREAWENYQEEALE